MFTDPSTARPVSAQRRVKSANSPIKKKEIDKEPLTKFPINKNKESPGKNDTAAFGSNLTSGLQRLLIFWINFFGSTLIVLLQKFHFRYAKFRF